MTVASTSLIMKALDALNLRMDYTAQNIANANTEGYRPFHVSFEERLRAAAQGSDASLSAFHPDIVVADSASGNAAPMRLDLELAAASQTSMRYRALVDLLARQFSLARDVIAGGR
ncbi:MAG: flagellar basal body protein [Terricaulis sp.]